MAPLFEIRDLCINYGEGTAQVQSLKDVSFVIETGDIFGIIGASGAGKSTLIRSLASLVKPSAGNILYQSVDIAKLLPKELREYRRNIGMIFQHFNLLRSRTVAANVAYPLELGGMPKDMQQKRVLELLKLVGLEKKYSSYISQLSGGEKQRVGIARALANNPKVLFSDEATSALDPKTTKEILSLLKKINKELGVTVVLITHEMDVIKHICNKVLVIEKGHLVEMGSTLQIFGDPQEEITKQFLQSAHHDIPEHFFKKSAEHELLRLTFKGNCAQEPLISQMVKKTDVDANIVAGWVDQIENSMVGMMVMELTGSPQNIKCAKQFLAQRNIQYEELKNEL